MRIVLKAGDQNRSIFVFTIILLAAILFFGNMFTFNTSKIVDIVCFIAFPFMNIPGIIAMIAFLIPLNSGITVLYIYGYAILMLLWKKKSIKIQIVMAVISVIVYEFVMSSFVSDGDIQSIIIYVCTLFWLLYMMNTDEADYKLCCFTYIVGTMVLLVSVMVTAIQNSSVELVLSGMVRIGAYEDVENLGGHVAVLTENANSLAYYALVSIILAFSLLKNEKPVAKIALLIFMFVGIVIGLFTISRTFLLVLLFGIFLVFVARYDFKQKIGLIVIVGMILYIGIPYLMDNTKIFDAFLYRFNDAASANGSGRVGIFVEYMEFLWNNPARLFFGTGAVYYKNVTQCSNSIHCGLEQILVSYGLIGFIPMMYLLVKPVFSYFKNHKFMIEKIIPLTCVIIFTQTIQFLNPFNLMLPYAIAIMYMKIPSEEGAK